MKKKFTLLTIAILLTIIQTQKTNAQEDNTNTVGVLAVDIKIPIFDEVTRQKTGDLELKKGDTVTILETDPDGVVIQKDNSIKIKEPLSVVTPESLEKPKEVVVTNSPATLPSIDQLDTNSILANAALDMFTVDTNAPVTKLIKQVRLPLIETEKPKLCPTGTPVIITKIISPSNKNSIATINGGVLIITSDGTAFGSLPLEYIEPKAINIALAYIQKTAIAKKVEELRKSQEYVSNSVQKIKNSEDYKLNYASNQYWKNKDDTREQVSKKLHNMSQILDKEMDRQAFMQKSFPNVKEGFFWMWFEKGIEWANKDLLDEFKKLNVPIETVKCNADNQTVIAVATALNYLYTKKEGHPISVSIPFLLWAHDMYPYTDEEIKTKNWKEEELKYFFDGISEMGEDHTFDSERKKDDWKIDYALGIVHPRVGEDIVHPVLRGEARSINLKQLLKGIQRFGVCDANMMPESYRINMLPPSKQALEQAANRKTTEQITVHCFNSWEESNQKDRNVPNKISDYYEAIGQGGSDSDGRHGGEEIRGRGDYLLALYYAFINDSIKDGSPIIETKLDDSGMTYNRRCYKKNTTLTLKSGMYPTTYFSNNKSSPTFGKLTTTGEVQTYQYTSKKEGEAAYEIITLRPWRGQRRFELYSIGIN